MVNSVKAHEYSSVSAFCQMLGGWFSVAAEVMQRSQAVRHAWMLPPFSCQRETAKLAALASLRQIMRAISRPTSLKCKTSAGARNLVGIAVGIASRAIALLLENTSWRASGSAMLTGRRARCQSGVRNALASALARAPLQCMLSRIEKQPRIRRCKLWCVYIVLS